MIDKRKFNCFQICVFHSEQHLSFEELKDTSRTECIKKTEKFGLRR